MRQYNNNVKLFLTGQSAVLAAVPLLLSVLTIQYGYKALFATLLFFLILIYIINDAKKAPQRQRCEFCLEYFDEKILRSTKNNDHNHKNSCPECLEEANIKGYVINNNLLK